MKLPHPVQQFFDLPSDSDIDEYLQQDVSVDQGSDSLCNSPRLDDSDFALLDPAYWFANPSCLRRLKHRVFGPCNHSVAQSESDLVSVSPGSITEPESPIPAPPAVVKSPTSTGSITEPESPIPAPSAVIKSPASTGSVTEPESPIPAPPAVVKSPTSTGSVTEPESPDPTPKKILKPFNRAHMFATPSPPGPDSVYWKYFTWEEDARMYDHSGTDKSFQAVRELKRKLQMSLDDEF
ncbi:hypothetical protein DFH29DRAFT_1010481 [Suillus ampliporus]|nr:hypothetical protein DFH29DRAFT_1010481 [Suillus ampliporus]